ncbi:hypothetical protein BDW02DRAFT_582476 [Decorospora gaudefroyi]|uniref:Uncharacterized protein n=1 Tax=Decorospora gaudefroyi TaxID=184978 RepID=A0A6A5K4G8_9PLEO|nr:hypothetical protein BDW02DRAFT_582476 [Decorospora gaudefroyi]
MRRLSRVETLPTTVISDVTDSQDTGGDDKNKIPGPAVEFDDSAQSSLQKQDLGDGNIIVAGSRRRGCGGGGSLPHACGGERKRAEGDDDPVPAKKVEFRIAPLGVTYTDTQQV